MNKKVIVIIVAILVIAGIAVAASHNNKDSVNSSTNSSQQNNTSTNSNSGPQPTGANEVSIINMNFSPASMTVKKGTAVKWLNNDNIAHTVVENDGQEHGPNSQTINPGSTYSFTFADEGVFHYHCSLHPDMLGTVTVTQ
jgi:plastocyanin